MINDMTIILRMPESYNAQETSYIKVRTPDHVILDETNTTLTIAVTSSCYASCYAADMNHVRVISGTRQKFLECLIKAW